MHEHLANQVNADAMAEHASRSGIEACIHCRDFNIAPHAEAAASAYKDRNFSRPGR